MTESKILDASAISAFAATISSLPREEIQKAKKLFILKAITDFKAQRTGARTMVIVMGVLCIIPIFLVVFIPALIGYRSGMKAGREKILNAMEVWKDDLGDEYNQMLAKLGD